MAQARFTDGKLREFENMMQERPHYRDTGEDEDNKEIMRSRKHKHKHKYKRRHKRPKDYYD